MRVRHLVVCAAQTETFLRFLSSNGWYYDGAKIQSIGTQRCIPLGESAPFEIESMKPPGVSKAVLSNCTIKELDLEYHGRKLTPFDHFRLAVAGTLTDEQINMFPRSHDIIGDLIIIKIPSQLEPHDSLIGTSFLKANPNLRLALHDNGVQGSFRRRSLQPLAVRLQTGSIQPRPFSTPPPTLTKVKESGMLLWVDPVAAYYSPRLANERQFSLKIARDLRQKLQRPLRIADPFCGVGPFLSLVAKEPGLCESILGIDLNSSAIKLAQSNVLRPTKETSIELNIDLRCNDSFDVHSFSDWVGKADLVSVNLPQNGALAISSILPILSKRESILIGWSRMGYTEVSTFEMELKNMINHPVEVVVSPARAYNPSDTIARILLHFG